MDNIDIELTFPSVVSFVQYNNPCRISLNTVNVSRKFYSYILYITL